MLVDESSILDNRVPGHLSLIFAMLGQSQAPIRLAQGMYVIGHHNGHLLIPKNLYNDWLMVQNDIDGEYVPTYGVCDRPDQLVEKFPQLRTCDRQFVIMFTKVSKADQSSEGGWRWHKWGEYIGDRQPTTEYLYDEPVIDEVYCFHIYERKS